MQRLTLLWFALSDLLAWPLLAFSLMVAIAFPLAGPAHARMAQQPMTTFTLVGTCALWLMIAGGAYAITRRRPLGLVLVLAPAVASAMAGQMAAALVLAAWAIAFVPPFILAFLQARSAAASRPAT